MQAAGALLAGAVRLDGQREIATVAGLTEVEQQSAATAIEK
ncbi:hypothetical protein AB0E08_29880 [Streptomyces sp. NPDC048281]